MYRADFIPSLAVGTYPARPATVHSALMVACEAPASIGQRLLWQMDRARGANGALNCPVMLRFRGQVDVDALAAALVALVRRHESLRTTFAGRGPHLTQVIHSEPRPLPLAMVDLAGEPDPAAALWRAVGDEVRLRADPEECPVRARLWRLASDSHVLCLTMHHLVTDGWSCAVVSQEIGELYGQLIAGGPELPAVGWPYRRWAEWQRAQLEGQSLARLQAYWREQLAGAAVPALPRAADAEPVDGRTAVLRATLDHVTVEHLDHLARARNTTRFGVLLAIYYMLLRQTTGETDLAIASMFANRTHPELRRTVGFLSNMLVLRARLGPRPSLSEVVADVSRTAVGAFAHQALPYQLLPPRTMRPDSPRADSVVFQMFAGPMRRTRAGDVEIEPVVDIPEGIGSRWEFELSVVPAGTDIGLLLCYANGLYDPVWAKRFLDDYVSLAVAAALDHEASLAVRPA